MLTDTAVGGKDDAVRRAAGRDDPAGFLKPRTGTFVEPLPFYADGRSEQRYEIQAWDIFGDTVHGSLDPKDHAGCNAAPVQKIDRCISHRFVLNMNADEITAGIDELLDLRQQYVVGDHQMNMDRTRGNLAHARDQIRKEEHRRREVTIGDIDMQDVDERFHTREIIGKPYEIS